ncbi:MAG: conjugal transfer protein TraH [Mesorhizobium sp.]|uniref:TraH family protein n=1 Tax=Mesorhizobium sp. TaxID=1871066 RepID=UPI000FE5ACEC|nr:TraH family protein [Mesorhizobium sp.]RWI57126.1 MAG: conjugal transfer protein TraH [Mesorhizobium sp.]
MIDAAMIKECADPALQPAIVERFIAEAGSTDPLAVTATLGNRVVLLPRPMTTDEAMALIREHVGKAVVRVSITQYPAGLGISDISELETDLVDACANIRMGTTLFGKVYRIVTKWYGNAVDEAFDDAVYVWRTGYFEGKAIFSEPERGDLEVATPAEDDPSHGGEDQSAPESGGPVRGQTATGDDPNQAGMRIDLSGIGGSAP